jgi:glucosamine--fructose-6-phosphate aminotransferase (isomerizing)
MKRMLDEILEQPVAIERCAAGALNTIRELAHIVKQKDIGAITIAARGTSDHAAVYGKYVLEILTGIPVGLSAPSVITMYSRKLRMDNSLVIGISQSGMAEDVLEVIRNANMAGALTVTITNNEESPLAREAQHHLNCSAGPELSVAATKTFTTQIYLLAALAAELAGEMNVKRELSALPAKISKMLEGASGIEENVQRYRFMNECFILARGINYAIALEAALKIQETNYIRAKAFATSDFYHGPFALLERDIPIIIFAPKGPSLPDVANMVEKLVEMGMELIMISNDEEMLAKGTFRISVPDTCNDIISPFFNVINAQIFAYRLAIARGLDPDSPRGLSKITITK